MGAVGLESVQMVLEMALVMAEYALWMYDLIPEKA